MAFISSLSSSSSSSSLVAHSIVHHSISKSRRPQQQQQQQSNGYYIHPERYTSTRSCVPSTPITSSSSNSAPVDNDCTKPFYTVPGLSLPPDAPTIAQLLSVANEAVNESDEILREYFRQRTLPIDYKSDESPVTIADKLAEAKIKEVILRHFPQHVVIGEESIQDTNNIQEEIEHKINTQSRFVWVIDPIDGTRAFICGRTTFTTLLSLTYDGYSIIGLISQPIVHERWVGALNLQSTFNHQPIEINTHAQHKHLTDCILQSTTPLMFQGVDSVLYKRVSKLVKNVVFGGDAYAYATLASGFGDVVIEADMKPWDFLALIPIVEGAGGVMSDWAGAPLTFASDGRIIASASYMAFDQVIKILAVAEEDFKLHRFQSQVSDDLMIPGFETYFNQDVVDELYDKKQKQKSNRTGHDEQQDNQQDVREDEYEIDENQSNVESMTGFGRSSVEKDGVNVNVTVRSVNSRHCEVQLKGIGPLSTFETDINRLVKKMAVRGRISVVFDIDYDNKSVNNNSNSNSNSNKNKNTEGSDNSIDQPPSPAYVINRKKRSKQVGYDIDEEAIGQIRKMLENVKKLSHVQDEINMEDVLKFSSDIFIKREQTIIPPQLYQVAYEAIILGMNDLRKSRKQEGCILEEDILKRTRKISDMIEEISKRGPDRVEGERERLCKLLQSNNFESEISSINTNVNHNGNVNGNGNGNGDGYGNRNNDNAFMKRIESEIVLFANRVDFTEEVVRLKAHVRLFELTVVGSDEPIGQRLTFLLQEMNRETNTLAAKAFDAPVSHLTVLIKEEIEKIREQCSNIK